jgi:AmmeMemoRadiSam system protein A
MSADATHSPLDEEEQTELLRVARAAIAAAAESRAVQPVLQYSAPTLVAPGAAFVSVHVAGALRGCIGTTSWEQPLWLTVARSAEAAASSDPRFPALRAADLAFAEIEISRLSPLRLALPSHVCPGRHGVYVRRDARRAVLLPKVAIERGWNTPAFLAATCEKAGLPPDAWTDARTHLFVFEAEVFGGRAAG